jgi:DNA-binding GntR family transcriptional regulator
MNMKKIEWVYREILYQAMEKEEFFLKQAQLSRTCGVSIGNVNKALKPLENINCIEKKPRGFLVIQPKKILTYWASIRNLQKDVVFKTHVNRNVNEIEKELPPVMFTAYSGYTFRFRFIPRE